MEFLLKYRRGYRICFIGFAIVASSCGKQEAEKQTAAESVNPVFQKLSQSADKYFRADSAAKAEWIKMQLQAYDSVNSYVPDIPLPVFAKITAVAENKFQEDFIARYDFLTRQILAYKALEKSKYPNPSAYDFASKNLERLFPDDYCARKRDFPAWLDLFAVLDSSRRAFADFSNVEKKILDIAGTSGAEAARAFAADQKSAGEKLASKSLADVAQSQALKKSLAEKYPDDYIARLSEFEDKIKSTKKSGEEKVPEKPLADAATADADLCLKAEDIFRRCVFTRHNATGFAGGVCSAILVNINGRAAMMCTKEFLPEKFPAVFSNSRGKIACSSAFICDTVPVVLMIPDSIPEGFKPLEIVGAKDSLLLHSHELYMIAPASNGFISKKVEVFSEDEKFLNLTAETAPQIRRKTTIGALDRDAQSIFMSISDAVDAGEHAVVIDPKAEKLATLAVRYYAPGFIEMGGKTGSYIGHENSNLPDFNTLVRQFDGTVSRTSYKPRSQINFIRLTALEKWRKISLAELAKQRVQLRKFTDSNNDFMMFFKQNTFGESLRLDRLRSIAERYKRNLVDESLERSAFEISYKKYMIEVLYELQRDMRKYSDISGFYPIYRDEMQYQINLRRAMYDYLSESLRENNMANILHLDLKTRYYESANTKRRATDSEGNTSVSNSATGGGVMIY